MSGSDMGEGDVDEGDVGKSDTSEGDLIEGDVSESNVSDRKVSECRVSVWGYGHVLGAGEGGGCGPVVSRVVRWSRLSALAPLVGFWWGLVGSCVCLV